MKTRCSEYIYILLFVLGCLLAFGSIGYGDDTSGWYRFEPRNTPQPGEIGMQEWLDIPAGRYGRISRQDDKLIYNGKPIKLWGLNLCYSACAPDKNLADRRAGFYPKYGINSVRLHKYADGSGWAGIQSADSFAEFEPEALDRMDYQVAKFKQAGIFVELSAHFGTVKAGPADMQYVPYIEEFGSFDKRNNRIACPHSAFFYSPELQNLHIRQTVNLLKHRNPYTGLTYAEDPVIYAIEIINEQSILFYTSMAPLQKSPTLRRLVAGQFSDWLKTKYGSKDGLLQAWGQKALDGFQNDGFAAGENLDERNILPLGNPWYWDPGQLNGSQTYRRQRLLDTLEFLSLLQQKAYDRYVQAVRKAGYTGEIIGSNWQAGRALSHYANLYTDYLVGMIDRHNYFGGANKNQIINASMLSVPGSGMLSAGMQQVIDRPFMLSEWIHVFPNEWGAEGVAIIAAYGMGLQGWDVSYMFQNRDNGGFSDRIGQDQWDAMAPQVLCLFPAVARQIFRADVKESEVTVRRNVHVPSLFKGKIGFDDKTIQQYDVKAFDSDKVPAQTLAVARSVVEFTNEYQDTPEFDLSPYEKDGWLISTSGQLQWKSGSSKLDGCFTINTDGTKAVVGFSKDQTFEFGGVTIQPKNRFSAIYLTATEPDKDISSSQKILVVAIARARNTGMKLSESEDQILERGESPILLEPVGAKITLNRPGTPEVHLLDHDGLRTSQSIPVQDNTFEIDGYRDKTCYYLITY
jgi:hypothetical protein